MIGCSMPSRSVSVCFNHSIALLPEVSGCPRQQGKLSDDLGAFYHVMGRAGLTQRQSLVKHRTDHSLFHEIESELQLGHAAHPGPHDPPLVAEEWIEMRDRGL